MSSNADGDIPRSGPWNEAGYCFLALAFQVHRKGPSVTVPRFWVGVTLAVAAAVLLSGASVSAVIAYGEGANPTSVAGIRFIGPIILLYALLRLTGAPIRLERRDRSVALGLGAVQAAQSYCLYSSFEHIPVGLTMIIFYIYPLLVGLIASVIGQDRLTRTVVAGLALAFIGLLLVFNVTGDGLNLTGAVFALLAALAWTGVVVTSTWLIRGGDSRPVTLHVQGSALILFAAILLISGDIQLPDTARGWTAYCLVPLFYGIAMTSFFAATSMIGSIRATLVMNFEAVATVILGYLVLSQILTTLQLVGGAFVILALVAAGRDRTRMPKKA